MKKSLIFIFACFSMIMLSGISFACLENSDDYAVEVVLNKPGIDYNLNSLLNSKNVVVRGSEYRFLADADNRLMVILSEANPEICGGSGGLSVRIQIPTITGKEKIKYLSFISKSIDGEIKPEIPQSSSSFFGWVLKCDYGEFSYSLGYDQCALTKENMSILVYRNDSLGENGSYEAQIDIFGGLKECKDKDGKDICDGQCISSGGQASCIDFNKKEDIESALVGLGVIDNFKELTNTYSVINNNLISVVKNSPTQEFLDSLNKEGSDVVWEGVMRNQLAWLKRNGIIGIINSDINEISYLAAQGAAGQNKRIIYGKDKDEAGKWLYYQDSLNPTLSMEKKCGELSIAPGITGGVVFETKNSGFYYIVPIALVAICLFIIIIGVLYARLGQEREKRKALEKEKKGQEKTMSETGVAS